MLTLDDYQERKNPRGNYVLLRFCEDLPAIAWNSDGRTREMHYRKEDIAHVPERLASILIRRKVAVEVRV